MPRLLFLADGLQLEYKGRSSPDQPDPYYFLTVTTEALLPKDEPNRRRVSSALYFGSSDK